MFSQDSNIWWKSAYIIRLFQMRKKKKKKKNEYQSKYTLKWISSVPCMYFIYIYTLFFHKVDSFWNCDFLLDFLRIKPS